MYLDVSRCILMYLDVHERDTSRYNQDTIRIQSGYITIHQDTYPIGNPPKNDRKPHVIPEEAAPSEPDPASTRCPAPRAPPRACSKAVGEMNRRARQTRSGRRCGQSPPMVLYRLSPRLPRCLFTGRPWVGGFGWL